MTSNKQNRNITIDIAKGICIVLVVLGHFMPEGSPLWYQDLHKCIYSFHMPLFLFASGYIYAMTRKEEPYFKFIGKKFKRLMIPYFSTSLIVISFKLLSQSSSAYVEHPVTVMSYVEMFYQPAAGIFLWFIWTLMTMFLIVPLLRTKTLRIAALAIAMVLHLASLNLTGLFCISKTSIMGVYFIAGVVAFDYKAALGRIFKSNIVVATLLFALFEAGVLLTTGVAYTFVINAAAFVGIYFIIVVSKWMQRFKGRTVGIILSISSCSYMIYLFHTLFEGIGKSLVNKLIPGNEFGSFFIPLVLVVVAMGVVCPMIVQYLAKKTKFTAFLFGLK